MSKVAPRSLAGLCALFLSEGLSKGSVLKRRKMELPLCLFLSFLSQFPSRGPVAPPHLRDEAYKLRITSYRCNASCKAFYRKTSFHF